jgi:hypothetical protein
MGGVEARDELLAGEEGDPDGLARARGPGGAKATDGRRAGRRREAVVVLLARPEEGAAHALVDGEVGRGVGRRRPARDHVGEAGVARDLVADVGRGGDAVKARPQGDGVGRGLARGDALGEGALGGRRAFCAALHPALGASSTPAPAVRAERTKVRRSMRSLMADAQCPLRARPTRTFTEWSQVQVGEPLGARA